MYVKGCVCALFKMYLFFPWTLHSILRDRSFLKMTEKDWGKDGSLISTLLASLTALCLCRSCAYSSSEGSIHGHSGSSTIHEETELWQV